MKAIIRNNSFNAGRMLDRVTKTLFQPQSLYQNNIQFQDKRNTSKYQLNLKNFEGFSRIKPLIIRYPSRRVKERKPSTECNFCSHCFCISSSPKLRPVRGTVAIREESDQGA